MNTLDLPPPSSEPSNPEPSSSEPPKPEKKQEKSNENEAAFWDKYDKEVDVLANQGSIAEAQDMIKKAHWEEYSAAVAADRRQQRNNEKAPEKQTIAELAFTKIDAAVDKSSFWPAGDKTTERLVEGFRSIFTPEAAEGTSGGDEINRDEDLTHQITNNLTIQEIEVFSSGRKALEEIAEAIGTRVAICGGRISISADNRVDEIINKATEALRLNIQKQCNKLKFILDKKNKDKITLPVQAAGAAAIEGAAIKDATLPDKEDPFGEDV